MLRFLPLLCSFILFLASCGSAPENKGGKEGGEKGNLHMEGEGYDSLRILHGDQSVLEYRVRSGMPEDLPKHYYRTGFIHPVYSPSGQVVTDDFPVGYAHQHAFFTAWTNTTFRGDFVDFWNTQKGLGYVHHKVVEEIQEQEGFLGFKGTIIHQSMAHAPGDNRTSWPILAENLTVRVHDRNDVFIWDVRSEQTNVTEDTLFLNKHLYGGLGIRGSKHWNPKDTTNFLGPAEFLTSDGLTGDSANHTHPEWTAISGDLPGGKAGMAVIPHPENFRWPVGVRVHPELPYFSVSPVIKEGFFIAPGETYLARYRVVVFDGEVPEGVLAKNNWAQ